MAEDPGCDDQDSVKLIPNAPVTEQPTEKNPEADDNPASNPNSPKHDSNDDEAQSSPVKDDDPADKEQVALVGEAQSDVVPNEQKEAEVEEKFVSHEFAEEPKYEMLGSQGEDEVFEQKSSLGCYQEHFRDVEDIRTYSQATDLLKPSSSRQLLIPLPAANPAKATRAKVAKRCFLALSMTVLTVGYAVAGGFLFSHLENHREALFHAKVDKWKNDTAILLATELRQVSPYEEVWARKVFKYLDVFERDLLRASSLGYRRPDDADRGRRWTFRSALFFSVSLMTTTGYGSMTPRSEWSRAAVAGYSLIGIPLAVTWFATLGSAMGIFWNWLFDNLCCHLCGPSPSKVHPKFAMPATTATPTPDINSRLSVSRANGFKPHQGHRGHSRASTTSYVQHVRPSRPSKPDRAVAIVLAMALFVVYFVFGSAALAITEGWAISESLYFNFVMLVTIGPGCQELEAEAAEWAIRQNAFYLVYLVLGFCLMSMVFYLLYAFCSSSAKSDRLAREEQTEFTTALY